MAAPPVNPTSSEQKAHTYEELAQAFEYSMLGPALPSDSVVARCDFTAEAGMSAVIVWPCNVDTAVRTLEGSGVRVGAAVGFPYGSGTTGAKLFEGRDCLRRGAKIIEFTQNLGQLKARHFVQIETEILQLADSCRESGAELRVNLETSFLDIDLLHISFRIAKRVRATMVNTGFIERPTADAIQLLAKYKRNLIQLKVGFVPASLSEVLALREAGIVRFGSPNPKPILDEWKAKIKAERAEEAYPRAQSEE
jgi:deoxyribose-phosphate aldolase